MKNKLMIFFVSGMIFALAGSLSDNNMMAHADSQSNTLHTTITSIVSSSGTVGAGGTVTLTISVQDNSSSPVTPTGTVSLSDGSAGGTFSPTCTISGGSCTVTYTSSTSSSSTVAITGTYSGDTTHSTSIGTSSLGIIQPHPTSVTITPSSSTLTAGGSVTLTISVTDTSSSSTIPSGIVALTDGSAGGIFSVSSCTLSSGSCTVTYTAATNSLPSVVISGQYSGDPTHSTSTATASLTVNPLHLTSVTITSNSATVTSGGFVTFTATVADTSSTPSSPTGTVVFSDTAGGTFSPASCTLSSGSCAVSYTSTNKQASVTVTGNYTGDTTHAKSTGTLPLTVHLLDTTKTTISPNLSTINSGTTILFTISTADNSSSPTTPSGTLLFSDNSAGGTFDPTSCTLSGGSCSMSYTVSTSPPSYITITAAYSGDTTHAVSTGTSQLTINILHATAVAISPSVKTFVLGGTVAFNATVTDTSSSPSTLAGQILWDDNHSGGSFTPETCTISSGKCSTSYISAINSPSPVTISAAYSGDGTHAPSKGTSQLSTATNSTSTTTPDSTTATVSPSSTTVTAGNPITVTATVTDNPNPSSSLVGTITWSDGGAGGSFSPDQCLLSGNHCALQYTPSSNPPSRIIITASYGGDSTHSGSSGSSTLSGPVQSVTTPPTSTTTPPSSTTPTPQSTQGNAQPAQSTQSTPANTQTTPSTTLSANGAQPPQTTSSPKQPTPTNTQTTQPATTQPSSSTGQPLTPKSTETTPASSQPLTTQNQQQKSGNVVNEIEQIPQKIIDLIKSLFHWV